MFDSIIGGRAAATSTARFVEGDGGNSDFGAIASYTICGCCGTFHAVQDGSGDGGLNALLNGEDRGGSGPNGKPSLNPGEAGAQITRSGLQWGTFGQAVNVTFAFRDTSAGMPGNISGFTQFTTAQINATLQALAAWSEVANITFTRVDTNGGYSNNATILFGNYDTGADGAAAFAYLPHPSATGQGFNQGDVWVNSTLSYNSNPVLLGYGPQVLLHEIGHAIGLSHPADYNAGAGVSITYSAHAIYYEDSRQYSVMSYFSETNTGADFRRQSGPNLFNQYSAAPLMDDIAAAQRLYGANTTTRTGDTTYGFNSNAGQAWFAPDANNFMVFCVWDAGGTDTLDFSGYGMAQTIDLRQGAFSSVGGLVGNVSIAIGVVLENAVGGSGADAIRGNSAANRIRGGGGNDVIDGGLGLDTAVFSGNRAQYTITWNGRTATVTGPDGTDTITNVESFEFADMTVGMPASVNDFGLVVAGDITNETIEGTVHADTIGGMGGDDTINGLAGADYLDGGSGNDILNGGNDNDTLLGGLGNDTLNGGEGDDILVGGAGNDALNGGNGHDVADFSGSTVGMTVNLTTGIASGQGADTLSGVEEVIGTASVDTLTGSAGNDILRGNGGADIMSGAGGNDVIYAGAPGLSGGAPDIVKGQGTANGSALNAIDLTGAFDLLPNASIVDAATIPHATIQGTTHGGYEFYAITVQAGETIRLDVDGASFDTWLSIVTNLGVQLANNDDGNPDDGGGDYTDSMLVHTFASAGTYYIRVGEWTTGGNNSPPAAGGTYTLHVSSPSQTPAATAFVGSTVNGDAGDDVLIGGAGPDTLNGGDDNDVIVGGAGNDTINGGNGYDIAGYNGVRRAYTANATSVTGGPEGGTDTLTGIEDLAFTDGRLTFARDGQAAQVMRLYDAAFNRAPDQSGFEALLDTLENGTLTLAQLSVEFINSVEFQSQYAGLTNQQFVEQMYQFCLNRAGDAGGIQTWTDALNGGMTRAEVLLAFSESAEHKDLLQGQLDQGLWVADELTLQIARLYDATYDRLPDQGGLKTWRDALGGGMALLDIAQAFATAPEFQARYGSLSNQAFVELMYQLCLDRNGDAEGIQTWTNALNGGMSRGEVLMFFSESAEHIALTRDTWLGGVPCTDVTPPGAPSEAPADTGHKAAFDHDGPLVLPGADDDGDAAAPSGKSDMDGPQVLPAVADEGAAPALRLHAGLEARIGEMLTLAADSDAGFDADSEPLVLPTAEDDGFLLTKADFDALEDAGPQILPTADEDALADTAAADDGLVVLPMGESGHHLAMDPDQPFHHEHRDAFWA